MLKRLAFQMFFFQVIACAAQEEIYQAGEHYEILPQVVRTANPEKIEVNEIFSYICGHCYNFQNLVHDWSLSLPDDVDFQRTHVIWNADMEAFAKAYYSAISLGVLDKVHMEIFEVHHLKRQRLRDESDFRDIFVKNGVDAEKFTRMFNSFGIGSMINQGKARVRAFLTKGTPEIVVDGKYRVTSRLSGSLKEMLDVTRFLVEKERRARQAG
ncbi:MAG: disulfide bond formation protein DsbA [Cellvibrionales bacterium TMED49]|nr:disulfide bond formation protein DsbA [Porticoccaceae bacterium]OUU38475.1 MAG: disulfide bond formation protein DsbA [Cellvibrionales bacterium TMED49]